MARLGEYLCKQGYSCLKNSRLALMYIALLTLIPFAAWLSTAIIALITLRKGWHEGFKGLLVAVVLFILLHNSLPISSAVIMALTAYLPCYLTAVVLHYTTSLRIASGFIVLQALLVLVLIQWLVPEFITNQYNYFQAIIKEVEAKVTDGEFSSLLTSSALLNQDIVASYLLGIQCLSVSLSAMLSLLFARYVQSKLFYPLGFRQEMLNFRASRSGVILLVSTVIGAYQHNLLAVSCLPILIVYYLFAGISLSFSAFGKNKGKGISLILLLFIPLITLPLATLPVYAAFGALDSLFNFRLYLPSRAGKENKG